MSDEVRSNSRPASPEGGGLPVDPVDGPKSLDIEFPTPDLELTDSGPVPSVGPVPSAGPVLSAGSEPPDGDAGVDVLPNQDISSLRPLPASEPSPPRHSERPPPPSQRMSLAQRDALITPLPPSPSGTATLPAPGGLPAAAQSPAAPSPNPALVPPGGTTLPAPAPHLTPAAELSSPAQAVRAPVHLPPRPATSESHAPMGTATEPPPPQRMLSEPVPLTNAIGSAAPPAKSTLRPGLVEPKRIIEVLGSNVPVLDSALEEEAIEDLDESEAHELSETPVPEPGVPDPDIELVIEDFPPSVEVAVEAADEDPAHKEEPEGDAASSSSAPDSAGAGDSSELSLDAPDSPGRRVKAPPNKRRRPPPPSSRSAERPKVVELSQPGARKWWEEMFSEEFLRAIPILSPKQLEREVKFIDEALGVDRGGRILDLACGAGQHAVELAMRGYDLVGFDLSQSQLDWAGGLAQERNQRLQFTYGDMRDLSYNEAFDAVYCWNTSFGFFEEDKNVDVVQRVFRALRPGGRFLLDVINRDFVVAQQPGQTWFEGDGCVCIDDVAIDFITSRMKVKRTLMLTNGKNRECNYSVRIYGLHELGKILHDVGFKVLNVSGRPEMPGVFFGATSPRIIILATKP